MAVSLNQLLSAPQITRVISTIKVPQSRFQDFLGMGPAGGNQNPVGGHFAGYDIFDKTRTIAAGRAPGTGPSTIAPQIIGHVPITLYRAHEKMHLLEERVFRTRPLGRSFGAVDMRGQRYVTAQEQYIAQRFRNSREFMISRMLRGGFDLSRTGDDWVPVESGSGTFTVDFQIPAGNKTKLDMLGGGDIVATSWDDTANVDIIGDILAINAANEELHGLALRHLWVDNVVLQHMLNNTGLKNLGGTANQVFTQFDRTGYTGPDGVLDTGFEVVFRGMPWLRVHSYDAGLDVNGTFTKFVDSTHAIFMPDPSSVWTEYYVGSEVVVENVVSPGIERYGLATWIERTTQPAGWEVLVVDNGLPVLYLPKAVQYGLVVY